MDCLSQKTNNIVEQYSTYKNESNLFDHWETHFWGHASNSGRLKPKSSRSNHWANFGLYVFDSTIPRPLVFHICHLRAKLLATLFLVFHSCLTCLSSKLQSLYSYFYSVFSFVFKPTSIELSFIVHTLHWINRNTRPYHGGSDHTVGSDFSNYCVARPLHQAGTSMRPDLPKPSKPVVHCPS